MSLLARVSFPPPASDNSPKDDIRDTELILTVFRALLLFVLFLARIIFPSDTVFEMRQIALVTLAIVYNILMGIASLSPSRFGVRRPFILAMDTLLIALWMHFSERWELLSFYYVVVVVAAMWYRMPGGILAAGICDFLFLFLWGRVAADASLLRPPVFTASMAITMVLLFVVGGLTGYIAEAQERERERRLERELLIANYQQEIDLSAQLQPLLVSRFEKVPHLDVGAAMQSARGIGGGDYLDAFPLPDGRTLLCIADVSGKGARAQARVPLLKYSLRALAPLYPDAADLAGKLQNSLLPELGAEIYIAVCLIVLDSPRRKLVWCNAGHIAPLLVRFHEENRQILPLDTTMPALGLFPEIEAEEREFDWMPGDALLLFTDGLADALSFGGEADGEIQVQKMAARLGHSSQTPSLASAQELVDLATSALEEKPSLARRLPLGERLAPPKFHRDDVAVLVVRSR